MSELLKVVWRPVRMTWRRLTSMRTALILLFLLAVAAVPGSLLPQRPLNPDKTTSYIATHGAWGRFLDRIGMFDVFGSVWFAAIYLLLFVSLIGCLIPRIRVHARAMSRRPLPAPRHLDRLPESGRFETSATAADYAAAARSTLGRRWRIAEREEPGGVITLSAEKGYSRETGNLLFHIALLIALVLIAVGRLYSYQGARIVTQGPDNGFCNTVSQYDTWTPGRFAAEGKVRPAPFCIDEMSKFVATYTADGEPSQFAAHVTYRRTVNSPAQQTTISVNHPLRLEGDRVYLIGHGFAPRVTVTMPDGKVIHDTEVFVPTNPTTLLSEGAFKETGVPGTKQDVGISGVFAADPIPGPNGTLASASPKISSPQLGIVAYLGTLDPDGVAQSVYTLDHSTMKKIGSATLEVGKTKKLADGVKVRFDGWVPWASLQVSHDPTEGYLLWVAVLMVSGLAASLGIRRRRAWLRITPSAGTESPSPTVVSVGGLARSDSGNFTTEFATLLDRLTQAGAPTGPAPEQLPAQHDDPIRAGRD
jgi:cytochrome c biogenesis protein